MGFQALFKFVKCWRASDVVRETVPSSWGGDGEHALAEFQTSARESGRTVCHEQLTAVKTAERLKRRERKVRWCKMVPSQKVPCTPSNTAWTRSAPVRVASGGCLWAVVSHDLADRSCKWLWLRSSWRVAIYRSAADHIHTIVWHPSAWIGDGFHWNSF